MNKEKIKVASSSPYFDSHSIKSILKDVELALKSKILTGGPFVEEFEKKFSEYLKVKHSVAVNSGTSALEIALRYFRIKNREVIVPTNTFVATPNSVLFAGGKPVFADIKEDTLCIDPEDVKQKISKQTAGIIVVHVAGLVCPQINELAELCDEYNLFLLEDSAHAHGAMIDGKKAGTLGDAGCFSFYPTKVMTTGEGGMITTNDPRLAEDACCMRTHGQNSMGQMIMLGHNWRMSEISAIIGIHQLKNLDTFICKRNEIAKTYEKALRNVSGGSIFKTPPNIRHSYYKYPIRLDNKINREKLALILKEKYNVETGNVYYPPCHLQPFYQEHFRTGKEKLPVSENVLKHILCLPMHLGMTEESIKYVVKALNNSINIV